jgi:hypothetical protein
MHIITSNCCERGNRKSRGLLPDMTDLVVGVVVVVFAVVMVKVQQEDEDPSCCFRFWFV